MKHFLIIAAVSLATGGAYAQSAGSMGSMGSIPPNFLITGDIDYTYAFDADGDSESFGLGTLNLGYRYDINSDFSVTAGVRVLSYVEGGSSGTEVDFFGYVGYRNIQFGYGAIENAASKFDWDFVAFENTFFQLQTPYILPIGLHPEFLFATDVFRVDAQFGNFDVSASYSADAGFLMLAGQTQFGNTRVLGAAEIDDEGNGALISLGANHTAGAFEFGGVIGFATEAAPFDFLTRISATYHINDDISVKAVYFPAVGGWPIDVWEMSATYEVNELFSIGASVGRGLFGSTTIYGINAKASF